MGEGNQVRKHQVGGCELIFHSGHYGDVDFGLACSQTQRQGFQLLQQLPQRIQGRRVGELTLGVKLRLGIGDVDVRHVHRHHVQRNADVAKMKLPARRAERADRCAKHRAGFAVDGRIWRARKPFQRVLENAGQREIVFRHGEDKRIGAGDTRPKFFHRIGKADLLDIGIVERDVGQFRHFKRYAVRQQRRNCAQGAGIIRLLAQAPGYAEQLYRRLGCHQVSRCCDVFQTFEISKTDGWKISSAVNFRAANPCSNE